MLNRSLRIATASLIMCGSSIALATAAHAQTETTTPAATETTVAETTAETTPAATTETTAPAATDGETTPAGGVAAGGGFLADNDSGTNLMPYAVALVLAGGGAGSVLVRRRRKA